MNIITEGKLKAGAAFIKLAAKYGAKLVRSKKHNIFRDAAGHQITAPKTTSDFRAIKNFESELRNRGFIKQETVRKVKDSLVKNTNVTAVPSSTPKARRTANQQTTFKDFTQKFQPNVQGPRKPNTPVKRGKVQGPETELENRMKKAYDKRVDAVLNLPDKVKTKTPLPAKMPKKLTDAEMEKLRNLKLTPKQRRKFRELGLMETNKHREEKLNYQYKEVTNPKKPVDPIRALKLKKA